MLVETPDNVVIDLPQDVYDEIFDERFASLQHYSRATYAKGCHGPLCRLAEKHRGRRRNAVRAQEVGREYQPNHLIRDDGRDAELATIVAWHLHERGSKNAPEVA